MTRPTTPTTRRPVRKAPAKPAELMPVFDAAGNLVGTCKISALQPLGRPPASDDDDAKAANAGPEVPASLAAEVNAKPGIVDSLQPEPASDAGITRHAVAKSARRAGLQLLDGDELAIVKRAADEVRHAASNPAASPAGVAIVRTDAAGRAASELQQHRTARAAARSVQVRKSTPPADPVLAAGYQAHDRAAARLTNDTPGGPRLDQSRNPTVRDQVIAGLNLGGETETRSWEAAAAALKQLRGGA